MAPTFSPARSGPEGGGRRDGWPGGEWGSGRGERRTRSTDRPLDLAGELVGLDRPRLGALGHRSAEARPGGELAERIGVHLTHVSRVETGKYTPGLEFVVNAAHAFGVTVDDLVAEHPEGLEEVRLEDREFTERIRLLEDLDERDRNALFTVMDAVLTKQRMKKVLEAATHEAAG